MMNNAEAASSTRPPRPVALKVVAENICEELKDYDQRRLYISRSASKKEETMPMSLWVTIRVEYEGEINTSSVAMVSVKSVNTERLCPDCLKQQILASLLAKGDLAVIVEDDECRYHRTGDRRHGKVNELEQLTGSPNYFEKSGRGRDSNRNGRHEGIMSGFDPTTKSIDPTNDLPVLLVRVSDDGGQLVGWCPFCRFNHY